MQADGPGAFPIIGQGFLIMLHGGFLGGNFYPRTPVGRSPNSSTNASEKYFIEEKPTS